MIGQHVLKSLDEILPVIGDESIDLSCDFLVDLLFDGLHFGLGMRVVPQELVSVDLLGALQLLKDQFADFFQSSLMDANDPAQYFALVLKGGGTSSPLSCLGTLASTVILRCEGQALHSININIKTGTPQPHPPSSLPPLPP